MTGAANIPSYATLLENEIAALRKQNDALVQALEAAIPMLTHATRTTNGMKRARLAAEAALEQVK